MQWDTKKYLIHSKKTEKKNKEYSIQTEHKRQTWWNQMKPHQNLPHRLKEQGLQLKSGRQWQDPTSCCLQETRLTKRQSERVWGRYSVSILSISNIVGQFRIRHGGLWEGDFMRKMWKSPACFHSVHWLHVTWNCVAGGTQPCGMWGCQSSMSLRNRQSSWRSEAPAHWLTGHCALWPPLSQNACIQTLHHKASDIVTALCSSWVAI